MEVNIHKCVHLPITNKTKPKLHSYSLCGVSLSTGSSHPYHGTKLDTKLTWENHITDIASKSSKVLGMVKRTLGRCKPDVKETAYNRLFRPKLKHASPAWNPHTITQIKHLEKVQHCAARYVKNDQRRQTVTTDLTATLRWPTLVRRSHDIWQNFKSHNQYHTTTGPIKTIKQPWPLHNHQVPHQHCSVLFLPPSISHLEWSHHTLLKYKTLQLFKHKSWTPNHLNCNHLNCIYLNRDTQSPKLQSPKLHLPKSWHPIT